MDGISKSYKLGVINRSTLQDDVARWWARVRRQPDPVAKLGQERQASNTGRQFWALRDIDLEVKEGEVIGFIGANGAGKSTLLKILSQVTAPTSGQVTIRGRVASLLEVGTGFHPDLTGRENIFMNGALLGMTKAEIRKNLDEIISFSGCEAFIDTPVKRYSSGMYVRLAFAVAAHLEPEILIVDEVLAVGDVTFQKKCLGKMRDVSRHGRTVLFVSHNMAAISTLCSRAVLLRQGRLMLDSDTNTVVAAYQADRLAADNYELSAPETRRQGTGKGRFASMAIVAKDRSGATLPAPIPGCDLVVDIRIDCFSDFVGAQVAFVVCDATGYRLIDANTALRGSFLSMTKRQSATVTFHLHNVLLKPGAYYVWLWLGRGAVEQIDWVEEAGGFQVHEDPSSSKHTESFPGVYQCRFTHDVVVGDAKDATVVAH